jgi:hypothetical protein
MDTLANAQIEENDLPIACNLTGAELEARKEDITENVFSLYEQVDELPDGYAFKFPGDDAWAARLLNFVLEERQCCPFFTFDLTFEPKLAATWLRLRGSEEIKAFVRENMRLA